MHVNVLAYTLTHKRTLNVCLVPFEIDLLAISFDVIEVQEALTCFLLHPEVSLSRQKKNPTRFHGNNCKTITQQHTDYYPNTFQIK